MRWPFRVALFAAVVLAVYVALAVKADVGELRAALAAFDPRAMGLALALVVAGATVRALRWRLYVHMLGLEPGFATTIAMGYAPGKSGHIVKSYFLQRGQGLPYRVSLPATFAERVSEVVALVSLLLLGFALTGIGGLLAPLLSAALVLLLVALLRHERAARRLIRMLARLSWVARHEGALLAAHERLRSHVAPRALVAPSALGLIAFCFESLALVVLAAGFGVTLTLGTAALAIALAGVAGLVALIPAGLGIAEGGLVVTLALAGLSLAEATALTLTFRLATLWFTMLLGALAAAALYALTVQRKAERGAPPPA